MLFENIQVMNFEGAIRGMRNPMNSWDKSDSVKQEEARRYEGPNMDLAPFVLLMELKPNFTIGDKDLALACKLINAGPEHRKFLRQMFVCVDITAPRYYWQEFDTYKVGTVANSCSTMHRLKDTPITKDMFAIDPEFLSDDIWNRLLIHLEWLRNTYNETKDYKYMRQMKQLLPESFLQKRTVTFNYENVLTMLRQRGSHRLTEWSVDTRNFLMKLPYVATFYAALTLG